MYEIYYKFTAEPFRLSPDHRFCFEHKSYGKARAYMAYAFKRAEGFVMITGRPGTGKTTLIGELVEGLSKDRVVTANLVCTQLQADDLLKTVAYSFGISPAQVGKAELLQRLNILLHRWHREGRRALLVVDEAQDLSSSAMEELRLLTNIQFGGQPLLQIFLLGQPELRDLILSPEMEQVHQRIVAASHIEGLEEDETEAYVIHRLSVVGWQGYPAIDRAIFPYIHRFSEGVPRRINLICSRLFLLGSVEERDVIGVEDVRVVIGELQAENLAAGTGIAQADFHHRGEPQWAPVPAVESHAPQLVRPAPEADLAPSAPVQSVTSHSVPEDSPAQLAETKKKEIPRLDPVVTLVPDSNLVMPEPGQREVAPEPALVAEQIPDEEAPIPSGGPATPRDAEHGDFADDDLAGKDHAHTGNDHHNSGAVANRDVTPKSVSAEQPSPARRHLILLTSFAIVFVVVLLVLKTCSGAENNWTLRKVTQSGQSEDGGVVKAAAVVEQVGAGETLQARPTAAGESDAGKRAVASKQVTPAAQASAIADASTLARQDEPGTVVEAPDATPSRAQQNLAPIVVSAQRRSVPGAPAGVTENIPAGRSLPRAELAGPGEAADPDTTQLSDEATPETAVMHVQQGTILISFPFDSDSLHPDSHVALDRAAQMLLEDESRVADITGFTDDRGDSQYNLELSRKRASAVERYLVNAGIARERLHVEGRGVLTNSLDDQIPEGGDPREPHRVVQIKVDSKG